MQKCNSGALLLLALLFSALYSNSAHAEDKLILQLTPERAMTVYGLDQQLRSIDSSEWDMFKQTAWEEFAELVAQYFRISTGAANPQMASKAAMERVVEQLRASGFQDCFPKDYKDNLKKMREIVRNPDGVPKGPDGKPLIKIPLQLTELLWLLEPIRPTLYHASANWPTELENWAGTWESYFEEEILVVLNEYIRYERRLSKLRLVLDQPGWVKELMGIADEKAIVALIDRLESLGDYERVIKQLGEKKADELQAEIDRIREAAIPTKQDLRLLERHATEVAKWFKEHRQQVNQVLGHVRKVLAIRHVDYPPDAIATGKPCIRLRVKGDSDINDLKGMNSSLTVGVYVCRPTKGTTAKINDPTYTTGQEEQDDLGSAYEEIDLGVTISSIRVRDNGELYHVQGVRPTIQTDTEVMSKALYRLGLPEQIKVGNVTVTAPSLDDIRIKADVILPPFVSPVSGLNPNGFDSKIELTLKGGELEVEVGAGLGEPLLKKVDSLQASFDKQLRKIVEAHAGGGADKPALGLERIRSLGRWRNGVFAYESTLRLNQLGPIELPEAGVPWKTLFSARYIDKRWSYSLEKQSVPGPLVDAISDHFRETLLDPAIQTYQQSNLKEIADELKKFVVLEAAVYDPGSKSISGKARFDTSWLSEAEIQQLGVELPPIEFTLSLVDGKLSIKGFDIDELKERIKAAAEFLVKALQKRLKSEFDQALVASLPGKKIDLLGQTLKITSAEVVDDAVSIDLEVTVNEEKFTVEDLRLIAFELDGEKVKGPKCDFRHVKIKPGLEKYVAGVLNFDQHYFEFGQVRYTLDGVRFTVSIVIDEIGMVIPCGEVTAGRDGISINQADLKKAFKNWVNTNLSSMTIGDLGPVKNIKLNGDRTNLFAKPIEIWLDGEMELSWLIGEDLGIPFSIQVAPNLGKPEIDKDKLAQVTADLIKQILPEELFAASPIKKPRPLLPPGGPYGLQFDLEFTAWVFDVEDKGASLTTKGLDISPRISFRPIAMMPVPTGFAIVNAGVVVELDKITNVGVVGDVTLGAAGIDKIIKTSASVTTSLGQKEKIGNFDIEGKLVLVEVLPLLQVDGSVKFQKGTIDVEARTTGLLDKLIQVRDQMHINAFEGLYKQGGSLGVLGIRLAETDIEIHAFDAKIMASAMVDLPIVSAMVLITVSPNFSDFHAEAGFEAKIGSFTLAGAHLLATASLVDLNTTVLFLDVRILAPSIKTMTPDRILKALLGIFDFDLESLFSALSKGEITISFFDAQSGGEGTPSLGQGDPVPQDTNGSPSDQMPPPDNAPPPDSQPANEDGEPQKDPPKPETPPAPLPDVPSDPPSRGGEEPSVQTYKPGDVSMLIVKDPDQSRFSQTTYVRRYVTERGTYYGWNALSKDVYDHYMRNGNSPRKDLMVIDGFWVRNATDEERELSKSRFGWSSWFREYHITLAQNGEVHAVGEYATAKPVKIEGIPMDDIGVKTELSIWEFITGQKKYRYTEGDIAIIRYYARSNLDKSFGSVASFNRIEEEQAKPKTIGTETLTPLPGYIIRRNDVLRDEFHHFMPPDPKPYSVLTFQPREGKPVKLHSNWRLYKHAGMGSDLTDRPSNALLLISDSQQKGHALGYLYGKEDRPMLFLRVVGGTTPQTSIWCVDAKGQILPPIEVIDPELKHRRIDSTYWSGAQGDAIGEAISSRITSEDGWDDLAIVRREDGGHTLVFGAGIDSEQGDWKFELLTIASNGKVSSFGKTSGTKIEEKYGEWLQPQGGVEPVLRNSPHKDLKSGEARRWLIDQFIQPEEDTDKVWNVDPFLAFKRFQQD